MKKILVSGCLYGDHVRYDDTDVPCVDERFLKWKREGRLIPVCPEVFGGLPVPRLDTQRAGDIIIDEAGVDLTYEHRTGAEEALRLAVKNNVAFAIMKVGSASCGTKYIYDGTFTNTRIEGVGLAVEYLQVAGFIVFNEFELDQAEVLL